MLIATRRLSRSPVLNINRISGECNKQFNAQPVTVIPLLPHSSTIHAHQAHPDDHMGREPYEILTREFISIPELQSANVLLFI